MADYIYLLQNRLTSAQWRALETVREAARTHAMPLFLVGGAVRDLTTGSPVRDLDFAVQGDAGTLIPNLEAAGATVTGRHPVLDSVYLTFRGGARAELGPSLTVSYPKPGQAEAQPAPILDDLRRRDFTANAMAVSLNEGSYGLLLDPLNGTADIENRELRLVSAYGFIEQPALLLRAARLSERLGFNLEERTATRYQTGKEEGYIQSLPGVDRGYELEEIFHEEDPLTVLDQMATEGWHDALFPALRSGDADRGSIESIRDLIGQLEGQGIYPDPSAVYFPLLTAKLDEKDKAAVKQMFPRQGFVHQVESIEARSKELAGHLTSKAAALPSESWRLLKEAEPDLVLWLAFHTRSGAVQSKIKAFLKEWPQMRQKIPYALMQEMRITPDLPIYEQLLDDLFFALIDGKLETTEATRAFLEPYSPPAPLQVTVRRRPAKATRSRSKRTAVAEPAEELDSAEAAHGDQTDEEEPSQPSKESEEERDSESEDHDDEDEPKREPEPKLSLVKKPQVVVPAKKSVAPAAKPVVNPSENPVPVKAAASAKVPAAKTASPPPSPVSAKPAHKGAAAKEPAHAKALVRSALEPTPKKASPVKAVTSAVKATGKSIPVKTSKSVSQKPIAKAPAKKTSAKVVPAKQVSSKAPAKAGAKIVVAKARVPVPAKRALPAKAVKKTASKSRSGR